MKNFKKKFIVEYEKNHKFEWVICKDIKIELEEKKLKELKNDCSRTYVGQSDNLYELLSKYFSYFNEKNYYQGFNFIACYFLITFENIEDSFNYLTYFSDIYLDDRLFKSSDDFGKFLDEKEIDYINELKKYYGIELNENVKFHIKSLITFEYSLFFNLFFINEEFEKLSHILYYSWDNKRCFHELGIYFLKKTIEDNNVIKEYENLIIYNRDLINKFITEEKYFKEVFFSLINKNYRYVNNISFLAFMSMWVIIILIIGNKLFKK